MAQWCHFETVTRSIRHITSQDRVCDSAERCGIQGSSPATAEPRWARGWLRGRCCVEGSAAAVSIRGAAYVSLQSAPGTAQFCAPECLRVDESLPPERLESPARRPAPGSAPAPHPALGPAPGALLGGLQAKLHLGWRPPRLPPKDTPAASLRLPFTSDDNPFRSFPNPNSRGKPPICAPARGEGARGPGRKGKAARPYWREGPARSLEEQSRVLVSTARSGGPVSAEGTGLSAEGTRQRGLSRGAAGAGPASPPAAQAECATAAARRGGRGTAPPGAPGRRGWPFPSTPAQAGPRRTFGNAGGAGRMRGVRAGRKCTSPCRRRVTHFLFVVEKGEKGKREELPLPPPPLPAPPCRSRGDPGRRPAAPPARRRLPVLGFGT
uniref:skin secretory protein xP2-like n=1 Tax=Nyctereutes procyonoides TaxID=34880 RepID=UPI002444091B|nr:skin secretory protein xP2-like [Nyctereutes procyonoides]